MGARCISPVDGSIYAERPFVRAEEAAAAVRRACAARPAWSALPLARRVDVVLAGIGKLGAMNSEIVPELAWQMGRPIRYGGERGGVEERAAHMAGIAEEALAPLVAEDSGRFERRVEREPCGVVLVIAPWNYPYLTALNVIVPALIAGNVVVLKHSSQTLLAGERIASALTAAGVPDAVMQSLTLDHGTTEKLISAGQFDYVSFTGSVEGGRAVERAAAGTFTGLCLELGGKDPGYVTEDADLQQAAQALMDGALYNSGQCCCGIERIYVAASVHSKFLEAAAELARQQRLGNPLDETTTLGPMAHRRFAEQARAHVAEAVAAGAKPLVGIFAEDDGGAYMSAQVLAGANHGMRLMREETFGPVVGVMSVANDEEAVRLMNDSEYGLTISLWTPDAERAASIGRRVETGTVFMNRADYVDPALCWTGRKSTGRGGALGAIGFHNVTRPKSYHLKKV